MKDNLNYLTKTFIQTYETDELDFILMDEFFPKSKNSCVQIVKDRNYSRNSVINIDNLITMLREIKKEGATHVEIEHNPDHYSYEFSAMTFKPSTQEEIDEYKEKKKDLDKISLEIQEHQSKIDSLRKELLK